MRFTIVIIVKYVLSVPVIGKSEPISAHIFNLGIIVVKIYVVQLSSQPKYYISFRSMSNFCQNELSAE